jgi:predicted transcriptional regulator
MEDVAKLKSMVAKGMDTGEMATELGRTQAAVEARRKRLRGPSSERGRRGAAFFLS